ncbi:hypothetical protein PPTS312_00290 [Pseudomonas putida]|uniref:Glycosyl transferase family 1 domain-containing protein n=1 Tax=Pseudomonas putida TaxID=303 RepID=A0A7U6LXX9_PSEPU|nr:hypothetical protein PPTS312_00290 [Pseudomonas putida]
MHWAWPRAFTCAVTVKTCRSCIGRSYWLLVPSRSKGLGLVVQEAVMADVPVVCSDLQAFREQLQVYRWLPAGSR